MSALSLVQPAKPAPAGDAPWLKWAILVTASVGALLEVIDTSIVNVALTDIQASLGATLSEVGWVITIYSIANVIILPLGAWLGDRFGKKRYFVFSLIAFTAASVLCGVSTNLTVLIIARLLQGLGGGGLLAKAQAILFETFPKEEQPMAQAVFGVCVIVGPAIGPVLGGFLTTALNWRWIFFINLPVGIVATMMALTFLKKDVAKERSSSSVDWLGILLLIIAVGSLQTVLEEGHERDWFDSRLIVSLTVAMAVGLGLFIWRELTVEHPVVDLRVLRHRSLAAGSLYSVVLGMGLYGAVFAVPVFAQSILHFTAQQTGMLLMPSAIAAGLMFPIIGKVSGRLDSRGVIAFGALTMVLAMYQLSHLSPDTGVSFFFWPLITRGIGTVFMFLPLTLATMSPLPKKDFSAASGFLNLTRQLGGSIGIAFLTTLLDNRNTFHRQVLVEKLAAPNPMAQERLQALTGAMAARGQDAFTAGHQAYAVLEGTVQKQSAILSFGDTFFIVGAAFIISLPLLLLLGSGKGAKEAAASAH